MKRLFYPKPHTLLLSAVAIASCFSCSGEEPPQVQALHSAEIFGRSRVQAPYVAPASDQWAQRYLGHLKVGTKDSHHFAMERLIEMGPAAGPAIRAEMQANLSQKSAMGYLVSLCSALSGCGATDGSSILFDLVEQDHSPVVRTAAYEAIAKLQPEGQADRLLALMERESETAPRIAGRLALARYGTPEAVAFLLAGTYEWLNSTGPNPAGQDSWKALLLVEDPAAAFALKELEPHLAPFPSLQAFGVRIALGERDLIDEIRPYLVAEDYPSPNTRGLALQLLGELGDWESVLGVRLDGDPNMQASLVALLRRPEAAAAGIGLDILEDHAVHSTDPDLRFNALLGLLERGLSNRLDPYLRQAREYPTGRGSVEAVQILGKEGIADDRVAGILIDRWPYAEGGHRSDLLKALTRSHTEKGADFLLALALDPEEEMEMRSIAVTLLPNFGEVAVPMIIELWNQQTTYGMAQILVPGLGRFLAVAEARRLLEELASSPETDDRIRRDTLALVPVIFKQDGFELLMKVRDQEQRAEIVSFVDAILSEYY
ncbi:MAG: HEAT repeat domain-containing protein [Planctomycetota bacterium]